ncbi:hypothetical protein PN498_11020 [Oscillatoria sp. CS-180]|uniref:CIS tube protein n=1 Tax=Oscillatoria sp. CS-180 TaxID=3021720 RepID=UPI00232CF5B1|nr:hypothetical protein [Oscillatoria sp. CS-180]MDB9526522.1 hypothetical protein [Oscillatoria sp. CS-180]
MKFFKAQLKAKSGGEDITFMFNPKELSFSSTVQTTDNPGARSTRSGSPRVSFNNLSPRQIMIKEIWFDTYETGKDVIKEHMKLFINSVKFDKKESFQRPPIYSFIWGGNIYFEYCFIEQLSYRLTKFLPNGQPVRAVIDSLVLKETEKLSDDAAGLRSSQEDSGDNRQNRNKGG